MRASREATSGKKPVCLVADGRIKRAWNGKGTVGIRGNKGRSTDWNQDRDKWRNGSMVSNGSITQQRISKEQERNGGGGVVGTLSAVVSGASSAPLPPPTHYAYHYHGRDKIWLNLKPANGREASLFYQRCVRASGRSLPDKSRG